MILLDRTIVRRFLSSFLLLFAVFFVLAVSLDVILQIDEFVEAAKVAVARGRDWMNRRRLKAEGGRGTDCSSRRARESISCTVPV